MKIQISYVAGSEGPHIEIGNYRVCGPKAWGGGRIVKEWTANTDDILKAVKDTVEKNKPEIVQAVKDG